MWKGQAYQIGRHPRIVTVWSPGGTVRAASRTDAIRLPCTQNINFSTTKKMKLMERRSLEFRAEFLPS
jgi:hypothetical protein